MNPMRRPGSSPLSDAERAQLDVALGASNLNAMGFHQLDGFLCALIAGPETVMPSEFLPIALGMDDDEPMFADMAEANRVMALILQHWNAIIAAVEQDGYYEPSFDEPESGNLPTGHAWARGFMRGVHLRQSSWAPLIADEDQGGLLFMIGAVSGQADPEWLSKLRTAEQNERIPVHLVAGFLQAYRYFLPQRRANARSGTVVRDAPKVGRNEPCPCGSGRKFKHCCAQASEHKAH